MILFACVRIILATRINNNENSPLPTPLALSSGFRHLELLVAEYDLTSLKAKFSGHLDLWQACWNTFTSMSA